MENQEKEPREVWIARARKGKTRRPRVQSYLRDEEYKWIQEFRKKHGLGESAAVRLCIRHVMVEQQMKERGSDRIREIGRRRVIDVGKLVELRGYDDNVGTDEE